MTRIFTESGESLPVTVIEALPNRVTTLKTPERDGYRAVQVTVGAAPKAHRLTKPEAGHFKLTEVEPGQGLWEFRLADGEDAQLKPGAEIKVDLFKQGQRVDVSGVSKGKGYAGVIKRHHFSKQPMSHGNSLSHRAPGSIGQRQTPGRVFPGKRMAGRLGGERATTINLEVVRVDAERNVLLVKGSIAGAENGRVIVSPAAKIAPAKGPGPKVAAAKAEKSPAAKATAAKADKAPAAKGEKATAAKAEKAPAQKGK
jgi:large subunit ribosomal protein L3